MIKRILVGLGGVDYTASAINQAVTLATQQGAELTGISIIDERRLAQIGAVPIGGASFAHDLAESRMAKAKEHVDWAIQEFTEACSASGVPYHVIRDVCDPFSVMIDQARYHDLMVFGLRGMFEFDIVPDPQDVLVRLVQAGVRPLIAVSKGFYPVRKVMIAYSGSMESATAMKRFVQMNLWPQAQLHIVTFEHKIDQAHQLVADAAAYCKAHGFATETTVSSQSAKDHLLSMAESLQADLIVVGNSAKNLLLRRILGETALQVIRTAERPLYLAQ